MQRASISRFERVTMYAFGMFMLVGVVTFVDFDSVHVNIPYLPNRDTAAVLVAVDTYKNPIKKAEVRTHIATPHSVTFSIAGDFMFARGVHHKFESNPQLSLEKMGESFFDHADASIVNLEGAISMSAWQGIAPSGSFSFIFPRSVVRVLQDYNINVVSLANNHSLNNGWGGFADTQSLLTQAGIQHFGGPTSTYTPNVAIVSGAHLNLVIIGVHTLYQTPDIANLIKEYKKDRDNRVLIMPHWGTEYEFKHNKKQERLAHAWIDAGADIVVGAHPHVVQDTEVYRGVPIVYSLGNFLFDQTERNTGERGVQDGMALHGKFTKDKLVLYGVPVELSNFQPQLIKDKKKEAKILADF